MAVQFTPIGAEYAGALQWYLRCLTFELSGRQRQDASARTAKMYRVPPAGRWWPAAGAPLERGVRPQFAALYESILARWEQLDQQHIRSFQSRVLRHPYGP